MEQPIITVAEFVRDGAPEGFEAFLPTFNGEQSVGYVDADMWAHCPRDNAGLGFSYAVDAGRHLVLRPKEVRA